MQQRKKKVGSWVVEMAKLLNYKGGGGMRETVNWRSPLNH